VTIFATFADNMKEAKLDINESTLVFEYPNLYYLDLDLKYVVNPADGNAKFDKTKKTLNIKLPVIGSTPDSQKVIDRDYQDYLAREKER
jgi:glutaredoxin-related protein